MKIVDRFGADSLRILEEEPEELSKISGISLARAKEMGESFRAQFGLEKIWFHHARQNQSQPLFAVFPRFVYRV